MKRDSKKFIDLMLRYALLLVIILPGFDLIYYLFLPLTKYPIFYFLDLFYNPRLIENTIFLGIKTIEIVGSCVGGSAYYFLLTLNLAIPKIKWKKRLNMILIGFGIFFILNLIRIMILSVMYVNDSPYFDATHKILWYFGSTILVILIWFFEVKLFKIKSTPFYDDVKSIYNESILKRKKKK